MKITVHGETDYFSEVYVSSNRNNPSQPVIIIKKSVFLFESIKNVLLHISADGFLIAFSFHCSIY